MAHPPIEQPTITKRTTSQNSSFSQDTTRDTTNSISEIPRQAAISKFSQGIDMWLQKEIRRDMEKLEKKVAIYSVKN